MTAERERTAAGREADRRIRPPSKRASAALVAACRADYRQSRAEAANKPSEPFKYAPLNWEAPRDAA